MKRGRVIGEVWATRKAPGLMDQQLKLVALSAPSVPPIPTGGSEVRQKGTVVVAVDTLDTRTGQEVLVAFGSGARNVLLPDGDNRHLLCDAAIALLIEDD